MSAGLTLWAEDGTIIYENPKCIRPIEIIEFNSYMGESLLPLVGGRDFLVLGFGQVNKRVGNYDNWVGGGISFINSMCVVRDGHIKWNILNNGDLMFGGWQGPFNQPIRGRLFVFTR